MEPRSRSGPILVFFLKSEDTGITGRIGLTIAPGKTDPERGWSRDLEADLTTLTKKLGASVLVSLMEEHEYHDLKIPSLRSRAQELGMRVHWFPIVDVSAPRTDQMHEYAKMIGEVVNEAREGRTVVVHCRGGIGRSGTVAASCLVALGLEPKAAIAATRQAQPRAVETLSQEEWVRAFARHCRPEG